MIEILNIILGAIALLLLILPKKTIGNYFVKLIDK